MNHISKLCIAGILLAPWGASQAFQLNDDLSLDLNIGAYSDYHSRGMSQTQNDPAIQGSVTLSHSSGLYAGVWSSNVDFGYGSKTRQEIDYYAGYYWKITDNVSLDLAYFEYEYPKESKLNYSETYAKLSAYGIYAGGYYSGDMGGDQSYLYSFVGYETALPMDIGLNIRYGLVDFKDDILVDGNGSTASTYKEWQVSLSKKLLGLDWSLAYVDSNLSNDECASYNGFDDVCGSSLVLGVSKSF